MKEEINKDTIAWDDTVDQVDLTDIFRTFHLFLKMYLFIHERHRLRERQRHRRREQQAPYREPDVGLNPQTQNHALSQRQTPNH